MAQLVFERDRDPTRGLVADIANFLAEFFQQGYLYHSLNAYRSAISSVHKKVNGELVGQHPLISRVLKKEFLMRDHQNQSINQYGTSTWF